MQISSDNDRTCAHPARTLRTPSASVLLLLPPPATLRLLSPRSPSTQSRTPFLAVCVSPLSSKRSPSVHLPDSRVTHTRQIRTAMFFLSFSPPPPFFFRETQRREQRHRARHDRAEESVHFQSAYIYTYIFTQTYIFSRRLGQRKRRAHSTEASRGVYEERGRDKENDRTRVRQL